MEAIHNVESVNTPEYSRTISDECLTCLSGTDPIIVTLGVDILQDPE